jgi:4-hydroxybenzoate polyprenyltransferase
MRLNRPIGTFLLLWPTLWALWIASDGHPDPLVTVVFVLGVVVMRSAGCVVNDYADRDIDPRVDRTQARPIAAGRVSSNEALALFVVLGLVALGLVMLMNRLTILLSVVGVGLAATYPFMKRLTHLPQIHLGVAFGWAVPMSFAAQTNGVAPIAWILLIAVVVWAVVYDTMYAMSDRDDDIRIGVKSTAILFGESDRIIVGALQITMMVVLLIVGREVGLGIYYHFGLATAFALSIYQQYLIRGREPQRCFQAFVNNNWVGAAIFAGICLDYLMET